MALREVEGGLLELDTRPLVEGLLRGVRAGTPASELAADFHESVVDGLVRACQSVRERGGPDRVVLSGGCFMNRRLDASLEAALVAAGFRVFAHRQVPANDGGLCLGQAAVAAARWPL
jgi:hydrogenase maturation protein HypF